MKKEVENEMEDELYHVRIIAYDKSNEYKYDLCRNESI